MLAIAIPELRFNQSPVLRQESAPPWPPRQQLFDRHIWSLVVGDALDAP